MCVPVADPGTGEVLGCLMVEGKGQDSEFSYFGHDDVQSLRSIALQLSAAIKRCRQAAGMARDVAHVVSWDA
jgi:GAF domain-containing protein